MSVFKFENSLLAMQVLVDGSTSLAHAEIAILDGEVRTRSKYKSSNHHNQPLHIFDVYVVPVHTTAPTACRV